MVLAYNPVMTGRAVAYLRRSKVDAKNPGAVSHESQLSEVQALAARNGDADLLVLEDWGKSGRGDKTHLRGAYRRLREMVESGEVRVIYGYSLSRLARSLMEYVSLAEACRDHNVPIRLAKEGFLDYTTVSGRLHIHILASVAQAEAEWAQERAADAIKVRRERGDHFGRAPYGTRSEKGQLVDNPDEPIEEVIEAFRIAGSFLGAARLLNHRGTPTRLGKGWDTRTVQRILEREAPEMLPARRRAGARTRRRHLLSGLLRCHCGSAMTTMPRRDASTGYWCHVAHTDPSHPRPYVVAETKLLPWVQQEAALLCPPDTIVTGEDDNESRRAELTGRRRRIIENYEDGLIERAERDTKLAAIDNELARYAISAVQPVPDVDWSQPPDILNAILSAIWDHIQLDEMLRPVRAEWLVPEWRR